MGYRAAIITASDSGYAGQREDLSGPAARELLEQAGYQVAYYALLPDDRTMLDYLVQREIPFLVVLTKMDKLNVTQRVQRLQAFQEEFASLEGLTVVPFSAVTGEGTQELRKILTEIAEE